jgi:hypothetical protein
MYKEFKKVSVRLSEGILKFSATHQRALGVFSGLPKDNDVTVSGDSAPIEIGAGLKLALSRCTSRYE